MSIDQLSTAPNSGNLGWRASLTMPIEYVAAMSAATNLGSHLLRAKDHDRHAFRRAVLLLASKAIKTCHARKLLMSRDQAVLLSVAAIFERIEPHCFQCRGAGEVIVADLKVVCPSCKGFAVHRYSDKQRARMCGLKADDWPQWESRYMLVMGILWANDTAPYLASVRLGE